MPTITYQGKSYECGNDESLLDSLNRQGANIPFGCRGGLCQACKMKSVAGDPPVGAQMGLPEKLSSKGYFLACLCRPESDLEVSLPERRDEFHQATIRTIEKLTPSVVRIITDKPAGLHYRAGQFINMIRAEDGLARSYSLASMPKSGTCELHIRLIEGGKMSGWLDSLNAGDELLFSDAMGDCCYREAYAERPLLLAGTGTGLAPLFGILQAALAAGHRGEITLMHGVLEPDQLYLDAELRRMAEQHRQLRYLPCVLNGSDSDNSLSGPIQSHIEATLVAMQQPVAYLCGDSSVVNEMRRICIAQGIDQSEIHCDAFG